MKKLSKSQKNFIAFLFEFILNNFPNSYSFWYDGEDNTGGPDWGWPHDIMLSALTDDDNQILANDHLKLFLNQILNKTPIYFKTNNGEIGKIEINHNFEVK